MIDYRDNSVVTSILMPGSSPQPYAADVTPDGRWVFVANRGTHTVTVIDTLNNAMVNTLNLRCKNPKASNPQALAISPHGNTAFVASNNKVISVIEVRKVVPDPLSGASLCEAITNYSYSEGSSGYQDLDFTPEGQRALVATNSTSANGKVLSFTSGRCYGIGQCAPHYMAPPEVHTQTRTNANRNPQGIGILPQRLESSPGDPWRSFVVNMGSGSDMDEDTVLLALPGLNHFDVIDTNRAGHPVCYGGKDVAVSPLGERAFIGFYYSNNIGMLESLTVAGSNEINAATAARAGCPPTCSGPGIREVAYTPYLHKVLATIWWTSQAESKLMILDASTAAIPPGTAGTISSSAYTFIQHSSINGPEGIGVYPLFDRDQDRISDLVEAWNQGTQTVNLRPTIPDSDPSTPLGQPNNGALSGGVRLPEEGMGYYHYYGTDSRFTDNWASLKLIKLIEEVGREWNRRHPEGPRIGIGDMSLRTGGLWADHRSHQNGLDADLRYLRSDGAESGYTFPEAGYSQALTQELMELFCATGEIDKIFYDGRANITIPAGCNMQAATDHQHHFHVRIKP